jgi:CHAT domain-containing protein
MTLAPAPVEVLTGFAASRDSLLDRDLGRFRILHFATHAVADMESPQLSTLVLSTVDARGNPQVGEVFAGDLLYRRLNAELVVLSACDTAMGQTRSGEGLLGLRYAAHAAGARTVVASLWPVVDTVGETIMTDFYKSMSRGGLSPVAALSQAMRNAQRRWPDPALWSVFEISRVARAQESIN